MAFFSGLRGFRIPEHRQFDYQPVFYDEQKERLAEKVKQQELANIEIEEDSYIPNVKGRIKEYYKKTPKRRQNRASNIRIMIFIVILSWLAYFFLGNEIFSMLGIK